MAYHSQTQNSFPSIVLILSISITFFLLLISKVNSAETVSFGFTKFHSHDQRNLILQSDANTTDAGFISLTEERYEEGQLLPVFHSLGRVLYPIPIHIYESEKDIVASFETKFTFSIFYYDLTKTAEGLAFFLAPVDFDPQHSTGGLLGVFSSTPASPQSTKESILAVEFDTFQDPWDPEGPHVGIDIKSIKSRKTAPWTLSNNSTATVSIKYDAPSFTLTVSLVYGGKTYPPLTQEVDLMDVLPPWVSVGLSATTGDKRDITETHRLHSWSFSSTLPDTSNTPKGFKKISSVLDE